MADLSTCPPLTPESVRQAHELIKPHIHHTPLLTCKTLDRIASSPARPGGAAAPKLNLFFKCENYQKIGAFKARGAFHATKRLVQELGIEEVRRRGVVTHSSGNHAQALALAAHTFSIPSYIVMPTISTPSKIAGTQAYTSNVLFSGSTSEEREAVVEEVMQKTGAILVPPYDHPDIILGQGTTGLEMEEQYSELAETDPDTGRKEVVAADANGESMTKSIGATEAPNSKNQLIPHLDAVIAPIGGGGLLSGIATYFSPSPPPSSFLSAADDTTTTTTTPQPKTYVFGAEPSYQGADDARRGLAAGERIPKVSTLTIADGLRTPVGHIPWSVISDSSKLEGVYSVSEEEIKQAMRLVLERMKVFVEPSGAVALAVALFNEEWRGWVVEMQKREKEEHEGEKQENKGWDVGIVFSGGNTTLEAIVELFGSSGSSTEGSREEGKPTEDEEEGKHRERDTAKVGMDGERVVENVAG